MRAARRHMKRCEIPFCNQIPEDWASVPNKYLFVNHSKKVGKESNLYQLLSLTTSGVKKKDINAFGGKVPENYDNYQTVNVGDIIFCLFDLDCSAVFSGISRENGMITSAYDVFKTNERLFFNEYANYWFQYVFSNRYYKMYSKNIRYTVTGDMFGSICSPVPPLKKQIGIVNLLNKKCAEIDELIGVEKRQIENLFALRQSIISKVIAKGIRKKELISTGVDYIGSIANDRSIINLKYLLNEPMMYGANESGQRFSPGSYRYIRITDISNDGKLKDTEENLYLPEESGKDFALCDGDILFARSGGTVGKTFIYRKAYGKCAFAGYLIKARCNSKLLPEYLYYFTQSTMYELWKNRIFIQATIQNIGASKYSNMPVVYCSINEQQMVVDVLRKKCTEIDELIEVKTKKIDQLTDYKNSLIYEYVTGKKEISAK